MNAKSRNRHRHPTRRLHLHPRRACTTLVFLVAAALSLTGAMGIVRAQDSDDEREHTAMFELASCAFSATGANPYFILLPGYQLVLEGEEDGQTMHVEITVLKDIQTIEMDGLGTVRARVVEEREWTDGELVEVSRNFYATCCRTNAVYYFGEDVDIYEDGRIVSHDGAWRAGQDGAQPGVMMPGAYLLGSRYYQEVAPDVALDRAEHIAMGLTIETPAGQFANCVQMLETTPLDPDAEGIKTYCPGVGLVVDEVLELIDYGFVDMPDRQADSGAPQFVHSNLSLIAL